jgi:predicted O-linked N-acetylglucosamine transferase (SPINDLY family)
MRAIPATDSPPQPRAQANLDDLLQRARAAHDAGEVRSAVAWARQAFEAAPADARVLRLGWLIAMAAQRWDWALDLAERWTRAEPGTPLSWQALLSAALLTWQREVFARALLQARFACGQQLEFRALEALFQACAGEDALSARLAGEGEDLQHVCKALADHFGDAMRAALAQGWQPALLRLLVVYEQQLACVWPLRSSLRPSLDQAARLAAIDLEQVRFASIGYAADEQTEVRLMAALAHAWPPRARPRAPRPQAERLRVGFVSPRLAAHATMVLVARIPQFMDHARYELYAYGYAHDRPVEAQELHLQGPVQLRALPGDAAAAAARIDADAIDVLVVLPDWQSNWLAQVLRRTQVPVSLAYASFCGATGGLVDYRIVDDSFVDAQPRGPEALLRLAGTYYAYSASSDLPPPARSACGLPDDALVLCGFNAAYKLGPDLCGAWARLLRALPQAVLWLHQTHPLQAGQLRRWFGAQGVEPARLVFAQHAAHVEHLARCRLADLYLDAWDYGGHTSMLDMLYVGVPALTLRGSRIAQRIGANLLSVHRLPELVAETPQQYEQLALALGRDAGARAALRARMQQLRAGFQPFDLALQARRLGAAIDAAYARYRQGLPPADLRID